MLKYLRDTFLWQFSAAVLLVVNALQIQVPGPKFRAADIPDWILSVFLFQIVFFAYWYRDQRLVREEAIRDETNAEDRA